MVSQRRSEAAAIGQYLPGDAGAVVIARTDAGASPCRRRCPGAECSGGDSLAATNAARRCADDRAHDHGDREEHFAIVTWCFHCPEPAAIGEDHYDPDQTGAVGIARTDADACQRYCTATECTGGGSLATTSAA